jgi:hypothetical protein
VTYLEKQKKVESLRGKVGHDLRKDDEVLMSTTRWATKSIAGTQWRGRNGGGRGRGLIRFFLLLKRGGLCG